MQDVFCKNSADLIAATEAIVYIDNSYWFAPYWINGLYKMHHRTFEAQKVSAFNEKRNSSLFSGAVKYKQKIFFIPRLAELISVYNIKEETIHQLSFQKNNGFKCINSKFLTYVTIECYLYLIPYNYNSLVRVNMETEEVESYRIYNEVKEKKISFRNAVVMSGDIYFAYKEEKCVLKFDSKSKIFKKYYPGNEKRAYSHLFYVNDMVWLIPFDITEGIFIWDAESNEYVDILYMSDEMIGRSLESEMKKFPAQLAKRIQRSDLAYFNTAFLFGTEIHLSSQYLGKNIIIQTQEKKIETWEQEVEGFEEAMYTWKRGLKLITYFQKDNELYAIDGLSGKWRRYENGMWKRLSKRIDIKGGICGVILDEQGLICEDSERIGDERKIGKTIFEEMKREWIARFPVRTN